MASSQPLPMSHRPRRMLPGGNPKKRDRPEAGEPMRSNRLLAGYLAHEFLTKGTLLGKKFEPDSARASPIPFVDSTSTEPKINSQAEASAVEHESYRKVASIMKTNGTHIKGIVNPAQVSKWVRM
ncbi:uncharacterized protein LOC113871697 [Abrus precatorius]|uniref:Uncharacterized protein LOC113871697 n=1 Tax=Abrus precatorius TaxID=3816 RepID=A0A8B8M9B7_ABRPR|nr:uncharacterized protein LOC113871697 [Abrus precatorius]